MDSNPKNWTDMASIVVAILALLVSLLSFVVAFSALRLARKQDERKRPLIIPSLLDAYVQFRREEKVRVYAFLLSISNPSDSDNALANMELHITYWTPAQAKVTVRLQPSPSKGNAFAEMSEFSSLSTPTRLNAHQTLTGWSIFSAPEAILKDATIEGYSVVLFDSHNIKTSVEPIMVREYVNEEIPPLPENSSSQ